MFVCTIRIDGDTNTYNRGCVCVRWVMDNVNDIFIVGGYMWKFKDNLNFV